MNTIEKRYNRITICETASWKWFPHSFARLIFSLVLGRVASVIISILVSVSGREGPSHREMTHQAMKSALQQFHKELQIMRDHWPQHNTKQAFKVMNIELLKVKKYCRVSIILAVPFRLIKSYCNDAKRLSLVSILASYLTKPLRIYFFFSGMGSVMFGMCF